MLIFNANQLNSLQEIFVIVLTLYQISTFLAFKAYLHHKTTKLREKP